MVRPVRLIVLGAGTPFQGARHSAVRAVDSHSRVLDWILQAFTPLGAEVIFVGGYHLEEVMARFGGVSYVVNENWRTTGSAASLALAPLHEGADHFVCYSDIVMRPSLIRRLAGVSDRAIVAAVDSSYPGRYRHMSAAEIGRREKARIGTGNRMLDAGYQLADGNGIGEFIGLIRIPVDLVPEVKRELASLPPDFAKAHLAQLTARLCGAGIPVVASEARGEWSDLNSARCLARFVLGTKGETLERLERVVRRSRILPQVHFEVRAWRANAQALARRVIGEFPGRTLAVRSSALTEDGFDAANAGAYASLLHVPASDQDVKLAVEKVIASFADGREDHQVLVQPMMEDVALSGVVLTRRLATGAPYYTINYATGSDTSAVTSGRRADLDTAVVFRGQAELAAEAPSELTGVLHAVQEVEQLLDYDALDIEFAAATEGLPTLLQIRPLVVAGDRSTEDDAAVGALLHAAARQLEVLAAPAHGVAGDRTVWGSMPDWNPAEIIGVRPRALGCSLYFHLITNETWAQQRAEYGYRDMRPAPLIRLFAGQPYVDVRLSLNSFIPATLPEADAAKLVEHCVDYLCAHPELHDKLEFEVIPTCFDLDFDRWVDRFTHAAALSSKACGQLADGLRAMTATAFGRVSGDLAAVDAFSARLPMPLDARVPALERAVALVEDCRRFGTLPFAHLARAAFVAVALLNSAVRRGLLSPIRRTEFLESLQTVSKEFRRDAAMVRSGAMSFGDLVSRYGHLRPGTYEITSERYSSAPDRYLAPSVERAVDEEGRTFRWSEAERSALSATLREAGLPLDAEGFERFARLAIAGRESSKFVFTRHVSEALESIAAYGAAIGLGREELSHISYGDLRAITLGAVPQAEALSLLRRRAAEGAEAASLVERVELPPLIRSGRDFLSFRYPRSEPNFITTKRVVAPAMAANVPKTALAGSIALIPQADPGYDWLFGHGIAGLVTMFGGANSHMAVRAAELGLPAAIGVGEPRFEELSLATVLHLDCGAKRITVAESEGL